jgi:hypothetical protein
MGADLPGKIDTYERPPHGWTCFHCGDTFKTVGEARDHFGADPSKEPGCFLKVSLGAERGLLHIVRQKEAELERYYEEDSDAIRFLARKTGEHAEALRIAEEAGYERGLRDARAKMSQR